MTGTKKMQWAQYENRIQRLPSVALQFICIDAQKAIDASPDGVNADYCANEILLCQLELCKRSRQRNGLREYQYMNVLAEMYMILREAGYDSNEMVDDLRELVNDSQRPATEEAE